jgi:hypothetical protein
MEPVSAIVGMSIQVRREKNIFPREIYINIHFTIELYKIGASLLS